MKVLVVSYHPELKSFSSALAQTAVTSLRSLGHDVRFRDLQATSFDPVYSRANFATISNPDYFKPQAEELHALEHGGFATELREAQEDLAWCELMIWQFPLWWFGLPAVFKGWVDRVFAMGVAYGNGRFYDNGVYRGKKALLSLTTGGPREAYLPGGFNGDIMGVLRPIHRGILEFTGFAVLAPQLSWGPAHRSEEERRTLLDEYAARLHTIEQETPIEVGGYC